MSCKSLLYMVLNATTAVAAGGVVPLGTIMRRFGTAIRADGNTITLTEPGYYEITVNDTVRPGAATPLSLTVMENGVPLSGAITTVTPAAIGDDTPMQIPAAVSRVYCHCCKTISFVLSAAGSVTTAAVTVVKV